MSQTRVWRCWSPRTYFGKNVELVVDKEKVASRSGLALGCFLTTERPPQGAVRGAHPPLMVIPPSTGMLQPRDPPGAFSGEEEHQRSDVIRIADPPERPVLRRAIRREVK